MVRDFPAAPLGKEIPVATPVSPLAIPPVPPAATAVRAPPDPSLANQPRKIRGPAGDIMGGAGLLDAPSISRRVLLGMSG